MKCKVCDSELEYHVFSKDDAKWICMDVENHPVPTGKARPEYPATPPKFENECKHENTTEGTYNPDCKCKYHDDNTFCQGDNTQYYVRCLDCGEMIYDSITE